MGATPICDNKIIFYKIYLLSVGFFYKLTTIQ